MIDRSKGAGHLISGDILSVSGDILSAYVQIWLNCTIHSAKTFIKCYVNCFVFVITLVWQTSHRSETVQIIVNLIKEKVYQNILRYLLMFYQV